MNLKLRLNLITTGLLLLLMFAGAALSFNHARKNALTEINAAVQSTLYLFDSAIVNSAPASANKIDLNAFKLQQLSHIRHLKIELLDNNGKVLDSNKITDTNKLNNKLPTWFAKLLNKTMPQWQPRTRTLSINNQLLAKLVITPDPSYEYTEIWQQMTDFMILLTLFFVSVNLMIAWAIAEALKPTATILTALDEIEKGHLETRLPNFKLPELARIGHKFNHMIETLQKSITRNHSLTYELMTLQEAERKSLARDLHDEFGQCLTAINTDANVILKRASSQYPELHDSALAITQLSRHLMDLVGGLLQQLRPGVLDELGLSVALQDLIDSWQARSDNISCTLNESLDNTSLNEVQGLAIYRLVQESLTNISRHASATQVKIEVKFKLKQTEGIEVSVTDNGKGFLTINTEGFGLLGMRERVEGLGGIFSIETNSNSGTTILAWIPLTIAI